MAEDVEVTLDLNNLKLTNRDMIDFERVSGMTAQKAFEGGDPPWVAVAALSWVIGRKSEPTLTWEETLDADVDKSALMQVADQLTADPTPPAKAGKVTSKK